MKEKWMALKRSSEPKLKAVLFPEGPWPVRESLRQACQIFFFSFIFAVIFDLLFSYGIELRVKPSTGGGFQPTTNTSVSPVGWGTPTPTKNGQKIVFAPAPIPSPTDNTIVRVSLAGVKTLFDQKSALFLDARPSEEYKDGHIPGAIEFYADDFDKYAPQVLPNLLDKNQEIICYCHGSTCELSITLARRLKEIGYTNVKVFFGGWPQWQKAGYPINTGETP
jgi:rhodanese-related sulfurtransferase